MPNPRYMGLAVGISLLSCIRAEIYVISYPIPVNGRHLCFTTYPDIGQHFSCVYLLSDPGNMVVAAGISLLSCLRAEIYVIFYPLPVSGRATPGPDGGSYDVPQGCWSTREQTKPRTVELKKLP